MRKKIKNIELKTKKNKLKNKDEEKYVKYRKLVQKHYSSTLFIEDFGTKTNKELILVIVRINSSIDSLNFHLNQN